MIGMFEKRFEVEVAKKSCSSWHPMLLEDDNNDSEKQTARDYINPQRPNIRCYVVLFVLVMCKSAMSFRLQPPPTMTSRTLSGSPRRRESHLQVSSSQSNSGKDSSVDEERRMAMVRYIQQSFYSKQYASQDSYVFEHPTLTNGGLLKNLPLWRVPWVELPGRTNVLNVHEAVYTNMFETLLRSGSDELFFGHLYLENGTKNLKAHPVQPWYDNSIPQRAESIGTLMRITDYRRLSNGRLLLLVQAIERFVVTKTISTLPYSRADVQLLPDLDQWAPNDEVWRYSGTSTISRAKAVVDSFAWHPYEFEDTKFQSLRSNPRPEDIVGTVLAQVLPYASIDPARLPTDAFWPPDVEDRISNQTTTATTTDSPEPSLEMELLNNGMLQIFEPPQSSRNCSIAELELRVWWAVNDYLLITKTPVSPVLLGFLPPGVTWPHDFVLHSIAQELPRQDAFDHKYVPVSAAYPARLRQRKLSFHVAALVLQNEDSSILLKLPSTALRLQYVLWKLESASASFQ